MALFDIKNFKCVLLNELDEPDEWQRMLGDKLWRFKPYDAFSCYDENDVYKLEQKLNDIGCTTRVARNIESGVLSVVVLSIPDGQWLVVPEIEM